MKKELLFLPISTVPLLISSCIQSDRNTKPNVIFILSDDHTTQAIGAYGSSLSQFNPTPNIDSLASEGALFTNTFCTNAISGPSRASIVTGKYSHLNGFYKNVAAAPFDSTQVTFPMLLHENGYSTAIFGKWHLESTPQGFDFIKIHNGQGEYWNPLWIEKDKRYKEEGYATTLTGDSAIEWLKNGRDKEKPFCMLLHFKAPHRPWEPEPKYQHLYDNVTIPYPDTFDDDYCTREKTAGNTEMTIEHHLTPKDLKVRKYGLSPAEKRKWESMGQHGEFWTPSDTLKGYALKQWKYQRYVKDYLATVKSVDDQVGKVIQYLKENGLEDNTIVIYCGDQGFFLGEHGWFDKRFMYEESMRMPFIVKWPEKIKPGTVVDNLVSNVDFAPTILDMCGITPDDGMQGESYTDVLYGQNDRKHKTSIYYHYYEYPFWHHVQPHYGIRTDRYKLIHYYYDIDTWEMFDLQKDPDELHNIYDSAEYREIRDSLFSVLEEDRIKYGDTGSLDDYRAITDMTYDKKNLK